MKKFNITILVMAAIFFVILLSNLMVSRLDHEEKEKERVYLVIKTVRENIDFWVNVKNGAEVAATELGVEVIVEGPKREIDFQEQIVLMEEIINKKPEAIAIAASEYNALKEVCERAVQQGITLVTYDSDVNMEYEHSFVATNNHSAAQRLAHELGTLLNETGKVAIIAHVEGSFTAMERENGFKQGLKPYKGIEIVQDSFYTDNKREMAYETAKSILKDYPDIDAILATNEGTLLGCAEAIRDMNLQDQIFVVGFDMSREIALMIEQGIIDATMVQKPFNMGYIAIKEALEVMRGKDPELIDTGVVMINKENMFLPENQKLIVPNVE